MARAVPVGIYFAVTAGICELSGFLPRLLFDYVNTLGRASDGA